MRGRGKIESLVCGPGKNSRGVNKVGTVGSRVDDTAPSKPSLAWWFPCGEEK